MNVRTVAALVFLAACSPAPAASPNPAPSATPSGGASAATTAPAAPLTKEQKAERWLVALEGLAAAAKQEGCAKTNGPVAAYRSAHAADLAADEATSAYVDETPALRDRARAAMDGYVTALASACH